MLAADPPPRPGRLWDRPRAGRRARVVTARHLRPPARVAAPGGLARRRHPRVQRRGLQPSRVARRAGSSRRALRHDVRHRGRVAPARARRRRSARPAQRAVRDRLVAARAAPADARPRPLRRAAPLLRPCRRRDARIRLRGEGAVRIRRGRRRAGHPRRRRGLHPLGPARAADGVRRDQPSPARRSRRLGARAHRRGADVVDAGVQRR